MLCVNIQLRACMLLWNAGVGLPSNVSWLSCLSKYGHMDAPNKVLTTEASSPNCE